MEGLPSCYSNCKLKVKRKLRKYEHLLKRETDITVTDESNKLMICNAGLVSGNQREEIVSFFSSFGALTDIVMLSNKSYSFVSFKNEEDAISAFYDINGKKCLPSCESCLYLLFVDKLPPATSDAIFTPPGLSILEDFISDQEEQMLLNCIKWSQNDSDQDKCLKHRQVKHFGYEFRYSDNNVDKNTPLSEMIPQECSFLTSRMGDRGVNLHSWTPDQLTVNKYEPGQGIPSHIDTHSAFEDPILSLSLGASIIMEWKYKNDKRSNLFIPRRSLLIMSAESRYAWTHGITPRKTDVVKDQEGNLTVSMRETRISFTFRKLRRIGPCSCMWPEFCDSQAKVEKTSSSNPVAEESASELETIHVHQVYEEIASHFSDTRHKPWPNVLDFVLSLEPGSILVDVGCGNGKYFGHNKSLVEIGCDYSFNLAHVCSERGFQVFQCNCLYLPIRNNSADACISIAVIHHLATLDRRKKAISEIIKVLKPGGKALIYVWAKNQSKQEMSSYLKQDRKNRRNPNASVSYSNQNKLINLSSSKTLNANSLADQVNNVESKSERTGLSLPVHSNRTEFQYNDMLVPWILKHSNFKDSKTPPTFLRFYHVFKEGELDELCLSTQNCNIVKSFYDQGNWCVILEKV